MSDFGFIVTLFFGLIIGIRHGIDLDHIAAITDIASSQTIRKRALIYSFLYSLGHGVMVLIIGIFILFWGKTFPPSIDKIFTKIVGGTLIFLGLYVFFSLFRHGHNFVFKSRWMLLFSTIKYGYHKMLHKLNFSHTHPKISGEKYQPHTALGIGIIHGIGAETPTQIAAISALVGIKGGVKGFLFLAFFISGIFVSNMIMAILTSFGYYKAKQNRRLFVIFGIIAASFSLGIGVAFLLS